MVTFEVGKGASMETFLIHKEFACRGSAVFEKAFNSAFIEGQTQTYKLEDVTPNTFRFFSEWLYS
jgi:BTB/POZ domain